MAMQGWAEGAVDAECSVELKKVGNAKAWWRRGRCLVEMGRLEEARKWVEDALEFEGGGGGSGGIVERGGGEDWEDVQVRRMVMEEGGEDGEGAGWLDWACLCMELEAYGFLLIGGFCVELERPVGCESVFR